MRYIASVLVTLLALVLTLEAQDAQRVRWNEPQAPFKVFGNTPTTYPAAVREFEAAIAWLQAASCDILITPHGEASDLWNRLSRRENGDADALVDRTACRRYAETARQRLATRLASEKTP